MKEKPAENKDQIRKDINDALDHLNILYNQSVNIFDKPDVFNRVLQLLDVLERKIKQLNLFFEQEDSNKTRQIEDFFFSVKKMKEELEKLRLGESDPHKVEFQNTFLKSIDHIKRDLNQPRLPVSSQSCSSPILPSNL